MKIGYLYYKFFPVDGGASIHGFHLAKELTHLGHNLYKLNGEADPYTKKLRNPATGFIWMLLKCDLFYVRVDFFLKPRNLLVLILLLFRKRVVVELNMPSDELILFGKSQNYIARIDKIYSKILRRVNAVIVVSHPIKRYCREELGVENVFVIENGANQFQIDKSNVDPAVVKILEDLEDQDSKFVVWSGSLNKLQDFEMLVEVAAILKDKVKLIFILKDEGRGLEFSLENENILIFYDLNRSDVEFIISKATAGLAFYGDYTWSRWGFYNSSLKIFEYLSNGLLTITNKPGTDVQRSHPNFRCIQHPDEIEKLLSDFTKGKKAFAFRSWKDVARETDAVIQKVVSL